MIKTSPKEFDLTSVESIWCRDREDLTFFLDFGRDISSATHKLIVREFEWEFAHPSYLIDFGEKERTTFDETDAANGIVKHTIDADTIEDWGSRKLVFFWQCEESGVKWVAADRTIYIGFGS